jgi:SAM-dependent methyltransferase
VLGCLLKCRRCGFVFYEYADADALVGLYGDAYFNGLEYSDYLGQQNALRRSMRRHLAQMARYGPLQGALLEVGCAYGLFLDEARCCFSVTGLDICEGPVSYARNVLGLDARTGDLLTEDFGDRVFDVLCLWDTIEHLATPAEVLSRGAELLRPGGMLYLTTGDIGSLNARWRGARWRQIHPPSHINYFSRQSIRALLGRTGYQVVAIERASYFHTLYNLLANIRLRGGSGARVARGLLRAVTERIARRIGFWIDLGDIMFVAARRQPQLS